MSNKKDTSIYEVGFHLIPIDEKDVLKQYENIKDHISKNAEIISNDNPKLVELEYEMTHKVRDENGTYSKYQEANLSFIKFKSTKSFSKELEKFLESNEYVLRYIIVSSTEEDIRFSAELIETEN